MPKEIILLLLLAFLQSFIRSVSTRKVCACSYPNWAVLRKNEARLPPEKIDVDLCTHIIYAYAKLDEHTLHIAPMNPAVDLPDNHGRDLYRRVVNLKQRNPSLKIQLSLGGFYDSNQGSAKGGGGGGGGGGSAAYASQGNKYSRMVADPKRRYSFIISCIAYLKRYNFDGLDLHWEFPTANDKDNFAALLKEMKPAFRSEKLLLTITATGITTLADTIYDFDTIKRYVDFIYLLTYDFHGFYEGAAFLISPLFPRPESIPFLSVDAVVQHYAKMGVPVNKMVIGIATYGKSSTLLDPELNTPGSLTIGPGIEGPFTSTEGYLAYYEICTDDWIKVEDASGKGGPYAFMDDQWVSFNDIDSVEAKSRYVEKKGLKGVIFWSLEQDDFNAKCGEGKFPLITAAKNVLQARNETVTVSKRPLKSPFVSDRCYVENAMYRHPTDCSKFYICNSGALQEGYCGSYYKSKMYFDQSCSCCKADGKHCIIPSPPSSSDY